MRLISAMCFAVFIYGVIAPGVNPAAAEELSSKDRASLNQMLEGDLRKLNFHAEPKPRIEEAWRDIDGNPVSLADYEGKVVFLNFWATWCPPCLIELPGIDRLAGEMESDDFAVIALSTDRFSIDRVVKVFESGRLKNHDDSPYIVQNLAVMQDPKSNVARKAGIFGMPVTVILDRQGREIARMTGEAEWDSDKAKALIARIIEMMGPAA